MKLCYTAIFGNYDTLKEPLVITPGWEYWCFTDKPQITVKPWKHIFIPNPLEPKIQSRKCKIIDTIFIDPIIESPTESIWFDASFTIKGNLDKIIRPAVDFDGMVLRHPHRSSLLQESMAVTQLGKDTDQTVRAQMQKYKDEGFEQTTPLVATGILYRKNNERTQKFSALWWEEVKNHSHRDQLSFNYALQKTGARFLVSSMNIYDKSNHFFFLNKHK